MRGSHRIVEVPRQVRTADDVGEASRSADQLLTVEQVACYLNVSRSWVYERVQRQELQAVRLGKYLRFRAAVLEAYLEDCSRNDR